MIHPKQFALLFRLRDLDLELHLSRAEGGTYAARVARPADDGQNMAVEACHALAVVRAGYVELVGQSPSGSWDVYRISAAGRSKSDTERYETKILSACALRFDGYRYLEEASLGARRSLDGGQTILDLAEETERFFTMPDYTRPADYLCAMLFFIQRSQIREGWRRWDSKLARIARHPFVLTCTYDVPARFRLEDWATKWDRKYAPYATDYIRFVEERDATTVCRDEVF